MATNSKQKSGSTKLTKFQPSKTVLTAEYLNSIYYDQNGTDDSNNPVYGHKHDGLHKDGHAQKINLETDVTGQLPQANIGLDVFSTIKLDVDGGLLSGDVEMVPSGAADQITFLAGDGISIVGDNSTKTIKIVSDAGEQKTYAMQTSQTNPSEMVLTLIDNLDVESSIGISGGTGIEITRLTDGSLVFSSSIDTNTTYSLSVENSVTSNSVDVRLTGSDLSSDNITITAGSNILITKDSQNQITFSATIPVKSITAGAGIITSSVDGAVTVSNDGVTTFNGQKGAVTYSPVPQNTFLKMNVDGTTIEAESSTDTFTILPNIGILLPVDKPAKKMYILNDGVVSFNGQKGAVTYNPVPQNTFLNIDVDGNVISADSSTDTLNIVSGPGIVIPSNKDTDTLTITNDGVVSFNGQKGVVTYTPPSQNTFSSIQVGATTVSAEIPADTLTVSAGTGVALSANSSTDTITITNDGVTTFNGQKGAITYNSIYPSHTAKTLQVYWGILNSDHFCVHPSFVSTAGGLQTPVRVVQNGGTIACTGNPSIIDGMTYAQVTTSNIIAQNDSNATFINWDSGVAGNIFHPAISPAFSTRIKTAGSIANMSIFAGFKSNEVSPASTFYFVNGANVAGCNVIGVGYYTSGSYKTGNWFLLVDNGLTFSRVDTGVAVAINTVYDISINVTSGNINLNINNTVINHTLNIPNGFFSPYVAGASASASAKVFHFNGYTVWYK